jgi:hypothetical protein
MMLRPAEVRAILGIKRRALAYARATGTLPGAKIDGVWQCSLSEMLLYLEKRNAKRRGLKRRQSGGGGWCHNHSRIELIKWGKKRVEEFLNQVNADDPELPLPPLEDFERYIQRMSQAPEPLRSTQLRCLLEMSEEWSRILRILLQPTSVTPKQL